MKPGDVVGDRFVIGALAGSGAMGSVYKAYDRVLAQQVALKLMAVDAPSDRFQREAEVLAGLDHPNIVRYVAHGFSGTDLYLAMDWLEGEDLEIRLKRGRLTIPEILLVVRQAASALGAAHAQGVVHRDVKPSNLVLVNGSLSDLRMVDFGLAAVADAAKKAPLTQAGMILGTAAYMAPEQVRGGRAIDARADIFSLGCVMFECLTLRCPFEGHTPLATFAKILLEDAPRASELSRDVPEVLDLLVAHMLEKSPDDRPENGDALATLVSRILATGARALVPSPPASLTKLEQRLVCVVLLGSLLAVEAQEDAAPPSLDPGAGPSSEHPENIARALTMMDMPAPTSSELAGVSSTRAVEDPRLDAARTIASHFGGDVEPLPDGSVVIVHRTRDGAVDQASRAARAALALREAFPRVRIALATGRSVSGQAQTMGEALDRASALIIEIPPARGIRIDEVSQGLLEARFEIEESDRGPVLSRERQAAKAERTLLGRSTACVGRERELGLLLALLADTIREREPRAALVSAAAGVGKSRLRYEFLRRAGTLCPGALVWVGWGDPMGAGSPFGLVAPLVRRVMGISDVDSTELRRDRVAARVARSVAKSDALRVTEFLGELVGAHFPDDTRVQLRAARADPVLLGDQMLRAWGELVVAEASRSPIIVVLEDIHWGDWSSLRFVGHALGRAKGLPLFVLGLGRPEMSVRFPDLWADRSVTKLALCELDAAASKEMIVGALGDVGDKLIRELAHRSAGNAFYLEELIRAVADGRGGSLPDTVLAVAQARLEGLTDVDRHVLRAASVFGDSFWKSGVTLLLGKDLAPELDQRLGLLAEREVIAKTGEGEQDGIRDTQYAFCHGILREAAHAMLTPDDCVLGHKLAGAWLETRQDRDPLVLAEHFERGEAKDRAAVWYGRAAEQALEGDDFQAAKDRVQRAFQCGVTGIDEGKVHLVAAEAHRWSNENAEAASHAQAAMALLPRASPEWFDAAGEAALAQGRLGQLTELDELSRELQATAGRAAASPAVVAALARVSDQLLFAGEHERYRSVVDLLNELVKGSEADPMIQTWITYVRAGDAMMHDSGEYVVQMRALVTSFEDLGDARNACLQRVNLADAYIQVGSYAEAASLSRATLAESEQLHSALAAAAAKANLARSLGELGMLEEAREIAEECVEEMRVARDQRMMAAQLGLLSRVLMKSGALAAAEEAVLAGLALAQAPPPIRSLSFARLAEVLLRQGRISEARAAAEQAMSILEKLGTLDDGEAYVHIVLAEALLANGLRDEGRNALQRARGRLLAKAATMTSPHWRNVFLTNVPENAKTLALAETWCGPT